MCKRLESIQAQNKAAEELFDTIEEVRSPRFKFYQNGTLRAVHDALREVTVTPTDMAVNLQRIK